jgi:hypothetical protein
MKKLTLNPEALRVESFDAGQGQPAGGTVQAHALNGAHAHLPLAPQHGVLRHRRAAHQLLLTGAPGTLAPRLRAAAHGRMNAEDAE